MIHYNHNTNKHRNVTLTTPKRHALAHYRHTQLQNKIKDFITRLAIITATTATLAITYLFATA